MITRCTTCSTGVTNLGGVASCRFVVVRDLANDGLAMTFASELRAPPALLDATVAPVLSVVQATKAQRELARRREAVIADLGALCINLGQLWWRPRPELRR